MTNKESKEKQSFYDFLCLMNANLRTNTSHYAGALVQPCIMSALEKTEAYERGVRCREYNGDCAKCIQDWIDSHPF